MVKGMGFEQHKSDLGSSTSSIDITLSKLPKLFEAQFLICKMVIIVTVLTPIGGCED